MEMWVVATFILIAGLVDDLYSRKVHNALIVFLFFTALLTSFYFAGLDKILTGFSAMLIALIMTIPLFALRVLGGGDIKLFAVFSLTVDPNSMFWTLVYSFIWGALFGLTRAALQKELLALVRNTYKITSRQRIHVNQLHKIPYTFALLLGWFTQLTFLRAGGAI